MKSEMETISVLSSKLRNEELDNERLRRENELKSEEIRRTAAERDDYRDRLAESQKSQADRMEAMLSQIVQFIMGNGQVSLSESVSNMVIAKIKEENEKEKAAMKAEYEEKLRKKDEEYSLRIAALESRLREKNRENDSHGDGGNARIPSFNTIEEATAAYLEERRQKENLENDKFGQRTESKYFGRNAVNAEEADMAGMEAPESTFDDASPEMVKRMASRLARYEEMDKHLKAMKEWRRKNAGMPKPRRGQPLRDFAEDQFVRPDGWDKADSVFVKEEVFKKFTFVPGYVKAINLHIQTYVVDGIEKTPDVFNKRCLATEELVAMVLYMHFVQDVTIAKIYETLKSYGLNVSESTIDSWIALGIDEFKPLMPVQQSEIVGIGEGYIDETHLLVRCNLLKERQRKEAMQAQEAASKKKATGKEQKITVASAENFEQAAQPNESVSAEEGTIPHQHYVGKWLHNIISPRVKLTQYIYSYGDRGAYVSAEYLVGAVDFYLHADGAKMYKSYDKGGRYESMGITRVGDGVHWRRPMWKLRCDEEDARKIAEKMDEIFQLEHTYKKENLSYDERKRRRAAEVVPILNDIKQMLDELHKQKGNSDSWKHPGLYQAVEYALNEYEGITNYLKEGFLEFDNNCCERQMRPIATLRNNSLFWGSHQSAERLATIMTIVQSCKLNAKNSYYYMVDIMKRRIGNYAGDLRELLANKWQPMPFTQPVMVPILK